MGITRAKTQVFLFNDGLRFFRPLTPVVLTSFYIVFHANVFSFIFLFGLPYILFWDYKVYFLANMHKESSL